MIRPILSHKKLTKKRALKELHESCREEEASFVVIFAAKSAFLCFRPLACISQEYVLKMIDIVNKELFHILDGNSQSSMMLFYLDTVEEIEVVKIKYDSIHMVI